MSFRVSNASEINYLPSRLSMWFLLYHYIILFIFLVGFRRYEVHAGTGWNFFVSYLLRRRSFFVRPWSRTSMSRFFDCGNLRCGHVKWSCRFLGPLLHEIPDWFIAGQVHWCFDLASCRGLYLLLLFFLPCLEVVFMQFFLLRKNIGLPESAIANMFFVFVFSFTMWPFQLSL